MATRLIINADDFGFSRGVTDGILRCHREGVLTSTTLMTNMPDRDRAIDLAGQTPTLGVGIHLNLIQGKPLTACRRIVGSGGEFVRSLPKLFWKLRSKEAVREAQEELLAQVWYAVKRGLKPTHLDSHKHVCHVPMLHEALINTCGGTGVKWIRCAREARVIGGPALPMAYRAQVRFARSLAEKAERAGIGTTDWFYGLATTGRTGVAVYEALAANPPEGLGELMVHPGYVADIGRAETRLLQERVLEMEALCNPLVRVKLQGVGGAGVQLVRYGE